MFYGKPPRRIAMSAIGSLGSVEQGARCARPNSARSLVGGEWEVMLEPHGVERNPWVVVVWPERARPRSMEAAMACAGGGMCIPVCALANVSG